MAVSLRITQQRHENRDSNQRTGYHGKARVGKTEPDGHPGHRNSRNEGQRAPGDRRSENYRQCRADQRQHEDRHEKCPERAHGWRNGDNLLPALNSSEKERLLSAERRKDPPQCLLWHGKGHSRHGKDQHKTNGQCPPRPPTTRHNGGHCGSQDAARNNRDDKFGRLKNGPQRRQTRP